MLIDFSKIEEVRVPNFKGGEKELLKKAYADGRNCIMLDRLMPGASIGRHTHETNSEIMYIVSGTATFTVGDTVETVQAGQCHYCPKGGTRMLPEPRRRAARVLRRRHGTVTAALHYCSFGLRRIFFAECFHGMMRCRLTARRASAAQDPARGTGLPVPLPGNIRREEIGGY